MFDKGISKMAEDFKKPEKFDYYENHAVTVKIETPFLALIDSIVEVSGNNRASFLKELIESAAVDLFNALPLNSQESVFRLADSKVEAHLQTFFESSYDPDTFPELPWKKHFLQSGFNSFKKLNSDLSEPEAYDYFFNEYLPSIGIDDEEV